MVFHWSLSDNKSPQVSRTLLGIPADLSNAIVWIIPARPINIILLLKSFSHRR